MSQELKRKLAEIEEQLAAKRAERPALLTKLESAKEKFGALDAWDENSPEYTAARDARGELGAIDDDIAALQVKQVELLKILGESEPEKTAAERSGADPSQLPGADDVLKAGWNSGPLFTDAIKATLSRTSGSKSRFGSIEIGQVATRDRLAADIGGTTYMRQGTYQGILPQIFRPLRVLDLIPIGTTDGNSVPYTQEGGTFNAAETAESAAKPEDGVTFTDATALVQTIAAWQKLRKQALSDYAAIQSMIDGRLRYSVMRRLEAQVLAGDGSGSNLTGILNTAGIGSVAYSSSVPLSELILTGITNVYLADGEATGTVLYPTDWQKMLVQKASGSGEYVGGGPFNNTPQVLWGVPLVPSPALSVGQGVVGDWQIGVQLLVREGVQVLLSDSDQDDFIKNRVTMLGEMRAALPVWRPPVFQKVALA